MGYDLGFISQTVISNLPKLKENLTKKLEPRLVWEKEFDGRASSEFGEKREKHFHGEIDISIISVCPEWH